MCTQKICEYGHQCDGCLYNAEGDRRYSKTGIDRSDKKAYNREWMRRHREKKLQEELNAAGVAP